MEHQIVEDAYALLRFNTRGELRYENRLHALKFIVAPDGSLVAPVPREALESVDTVLHVPEYREGALELLVALSPLSPAGADACLIDRWQIYYGQAREPDRAKMAIDSARYQGTMIDGEALTRRNPLAAEEPALCRFVNSSHVDALRAVVARVTSVRVEKPVMVGADPGGIDVRASFGIIRLAFTRAAPTGAAARAALEALLDRGGTEPALPDEPV